MAYEEAYNKYIECDQDRDWEWTIKIKFNGEEVFTWNDDNNIECPEDLTWSRELGEIFRKGFELGYKARELDNEQG